MIIIFFVPVQLITTYATNFITKTQLEALYSHMSVSPAPAHLVFTPLCVTQLLFQG